MVKDLFKPGDVLFYDKIHDGISNLSNEDAETEIYFDYSQYVALGVVVAVDEITSTLKLVTPVTDLFILRNIQNCVDKEILKGMNDRIKEYKKFFTKQCGSQKTIKFYIPNEDDINLLQDNAGDVVRGCEALKYFCNSNMNPEFNIVEILMNEQIGFIDKKKLKILLGGLTSAILNKEEYERVRREKEQEEQRIADYDRQFGMRPGVEIHYAYKQDSENIDDFYKNGKPEEALAKSKDVTKAGQFEKEDISDRMEEEIKVMYPRIAKLDYKVTLEDIAEEFKKVEQVCFYSVPFMSILID